MVNSDGPAAEHNCCLTWACVLRVLFQCLADFDFVARK